MVGSAIASILSGIDAEVAGGRIPDSRGSDWIIYNMISTVPHNSKSGASDYDRYRFQIDCYSRTYEEVDTIASSVRSAMDEYAGTVESVVIDHIFYDGENDLPVESIEEMESREDYFRRSQDYIIYVRP